MLLFNAVQLSVWTEIVVTSTSPIKSQLLFSFEAIGIEVQSRLMCVSFIVDLKRNDSSFNWQFFFLHNERSKAQSDRAIQKTRMIKERKPTLF